MHDHQIDAYLIPSSDPHQSEYQAEHWKIKEWFSGFTGSAGTLVVTQKHAGLWTDSRYFLQAEDQLAGTGIKLQKQTIPHTPQHVDWLEKHLPKGATIGCNGLLYSPSQIRQMAKRFYKKDIQINSDLDLISEIWKDRPSLPESPIFELAKKYAGESREKKLSHIRKQMKTQSVDFHLVSTLDDIAWIFNIRGRDIDFNPVVMAYALIGLEIAYLIIDPSKVSDSLKTKLRNEGIFIKPYHEITRLLHRLPKGQKILVDYNRINISLYNSIANEQIVEGTTISTPLKAIKNKTEIKNLKVAMRKDGVALTKLFRWLASTLKKRAISEVEVAEQLIEFRSMQGDYFGESFSAIVGYNANGAIVHYRPEEGKCAMIKNSGILLLDSGGQYFHGTTDITRTLALGKVTEQQKRHFTLVLKGNIGLSTLSFPKGTRGNQMEILARQHLWQHGLNYGHGTGHGVGYFLNVHEGPQAFGSGATAKAATPFELGMLTSNEPGFYLTGKYGIRIENLELTVKDKKTDFGEFYKFETMSLFPIDKKMIDKTLLSPNEKQWLNAYHQRVFKTLSPHLNNTEVKWLKTQCSKI